MEPLLSLEVIERSIVARLSLKTNMNPSNEINTLTEKSLVHYLIQCWKRAQTQKRVITRKVAENLRNTIDEICETIMNLSVSYVGLLLQFPSMFPQPNDVTNMGASLLAMFVKLLVIDDKNCIPFEMLSCLVSRFEDELVEIFSPVVAHLSGEFRQMKFGENYIPTLKAFSLLIQFTTIALMLPSLPSWNPPSTSARSFELLTLMGPFFKLSPFGTDDYECVKSLYGETSNRSRSNVESAFMSTRLSLESLQKELHQIMLAIVKSSPS